MYKPTPVEMYNYDDYKEYLSNIIRNIEEDNKKDKAKIDELLDDYKNKPESVFNVSDDGIHSRMVVHRNTDYFIDAVGLSYRVFLRKHQYEDLKRELAYLNTDEGKNAYEMKMGRYSNTVLLWG